MKNTHDIDYIHPYSNRTCPASGDKLWLNTSRLNNSSALDMAVDMVDTDIAVVEPGPPVPNPSHNTSADVTFDIHDLSSIVGRDDISSLSADIPLNSTPQPSLKVSG